MIHVLNIKDKIKNNNNNKKLKGMFKMTKITDKMNKVIK